jgi:hypothetical protein
MNKKTPRIRTAESNQSKNSNNLMVRSPVRPATSNITKSPRSEAIKTQISNLTRKKDEMSYILLQDELLGNGKLNISER